MYLDITYSDIATRRISATEQDRRITSHLVMLGMVLPNVQGSSLQATYVAPAPILIPPHQPSRQVAVVSNETGHEYNVWFSSDYRWLTDVRTDDCRHAWRIDSLRADGTKAFRGYNRQRNDAELACALLSAEAFPAGKSYPFTVRDAMRIPGSESRLLFWFGLEPLGGCSSTCSECIVDDPKQVIRCIPWLLAAEREAIRQWGSIHFKDHPPIVIARDSELA